MKKNWTIIGLLVSLIITFACLKTAWAGFVYFGISCIVLLCAFIIYLRIKLYIKDYYTNYDKAFIVFRAEIINTSNMTSEDFDNNIQSYQKEFNKLLRREKMIDIFKMLFIVTVLVVSIIAIIKI